MVQQLGGNCLSGSTRKQQVQSRQQSAITLLFSALVVALLAVAITIRPVHAQSAEDAANSLTDSTTDAVINLNQRIIGGRRAVPGEWPAVVALLRAHSGFSLTTRQYCGGTLIASRWVATAAHCLFDSFHTQIDPSSIRVVAGINNLRTDIPDEETVVVNMIVHPDYVPSNVTSPNDIALLELATELTTPTIPVFGADPTVLTGSNASVVGWGATDLSNPKNPVYPDNLQEATVPIVANDVCNAPRSYNGLVTPSQLCAGFQAGQVDACKGDSGGPLLADVNGIRMLIGIVSFGRGCAEPDFYGVYTSVAHFSDWMQSFVEVADIQTRGLPLLASNASTPPSAVSGLHTGSNTESDVGPETGSNGGAGAGPGLLILAAGILVVRERRRR